MSFKPTFLLILMTFLIIGCSNDDSTNETSNSRTFIGNKYAHLLIDTREECQARPVEESCAQLLEIINDSQVDIAFTDVFHRANFYIDNDKLIIESASGIPENLVFEILENGDLKLEQEIWIKYENNYYE